MSYLYQYKKILKCISFIQGVRTPTLQLSAMQEGDYTFQLTVTDSSGQQDTAQVTVIVQPGERLITFYIRYGTA